MPPQKSAIWNYFKRSQIGNTVKCTLCDAQLTFCGVTKFDFLLSGSPGKCETQDELELQSYLLDKSDLEKFPLNQISTIISYCKTYVSSTGNIRSFGEDVFICRTNYNKTSK
jgi:hypothetical protein